MEYFINLPEEMTLEILTRLPTEAVLDSKLVCTNWRNFICMNPLFSKRHLHHLNRDSGMLGFTALTLKNRLYYFILPTRSVDIVGSFNGLICFARLSPVQSQTYVCNPITKELLMLPDIIKTGCDDYARGFGYISSTNEYKVLRIMSKDSKFLEVYIYTLGSGNGWRNISNLDFSFGFSKEGWGGGIFSDGVIYWLDMESNMIVTFDLTEEKFGENLSLPPLPLEGNWFYEGIGILDGLLFLSAGKVVGQVFEGATFSDILSLERCYDIWLLKSKNDNHGMEERKQHQSLGWNKEFNMANKSRFFAVTEEENILTYHKSSLNIYDPKASTSKLLVDLKEHIRRVFPHKNTLVSLKELGEEDTKIMEPIEIKERERAMTNL